MYGSGGAGRLLLLLPLLLVFLDLAMALLYWLLLQCLPYPAPLHPTFTPLPLQVAAINTAMSALVKTLNVFPKERSIVARERTRKAYNVLPYLSGTAAPS